MVTEVRQRVAREQHGRRGRTIDPAWAHRRMLLSAGDRLTPAQLVRLGRVLAADDPTDEIGAAWAVKELLRQLLNERDPDRIRHRLWRFYDAAARVDLPEATRLAQTIETWWPHIQVFLPDAMADLVRDVQVSTARAVFVCSHNSARSQLAAALWCVRSSIPATSAGTEPAAHVHPDAVAAARRHQLTLPTRRPVHINNVLAHGDLLVAVCDAAHEHLGADVPPRLHWSVPDPVRVGTEDAFERAYVDLEDRVGRLAEAITLN